MTKYYAVQQEGTTADVYIFGDITSYPWLESDVSAYNIVQELTSIDASVINVYINSCGGSVSEGWAIYNALKQHKAQVNTFGMGFVASAALYPFMAGDNRYACATSAYYFHHMISSVQGYADDLRRAADDVDKLNEIGRQAFTVNTDLTDEDIIALEDGKTWLSAQAVFDNGIATAIIKDTQISSGLTQSVRKDILQKILAPIKPTQKETEPPMPTQAAAELPPEEKQPSLLQTLSGFFNA